MWAHAIRRHQNGCYVNTLCVCGATYFKLILRICSLYHDKNCYINFHVPELNNITVYCILFFACCLVRHLIGDVWAQTVHNIGYMALFEFRLKFGVCAVFASLILLHLTIAPRTQLQGGGEQISKILLGKSKRDHHTHMWIVHYILSNFLLDCCWFAVAKNHTIIYYGANFLRPEKRAKRRKCVTLTPLSRKTKLCGCMKRSERQMNGTRET